MLSEKHEDEPENGPSTVLRRSALWRSADGQRVPVGLLSVARTEQGEHQIQFQSRENETEVAKRIMELAKEISRMVRGPGADEHRRSLSAEQVEDIWRTLLERLRSEGLEVEDIPLSDCEVQVTYDLRSGEIVGTHKALHGLTESAPGLARKISAVVAAALKRPSEALTLEIQKLTAGGASRAAASAIRRGVESGAFSFGVEPALLNAMLAVDLSTADPADRLPVRRARIAAASMLHREELAADDATTLLAEHGAELDQDEKLSVRMLQGVIAARRGKKETALAIWRELQKSADAMPAADRGWLYRNMAISLSRSSAEAQHYARLSSDAFLEGGDRVEAAKSAVGLAEGLLFQRPDEALRLLDEAARWFDGDTAIDRHHRAGLLHLRAKAELQLHRGANSLQTAKEAARLRHGLLQAEPQLISSLHLAAFAADAAGLDEEASQYRMAAGDLTREVQDPDSLFAEEFGQWLRSYDAATGDALLKRAIETDNARAQAFVLTMQAMHDTGLDLAGRLELLERALELLRSTKNARDGEEGMDAAAVHLAIAMQLSNAGEDDRALAYYRKVLDIDALDPTAGNNYVALLWKLGRAREAAEYARNHMETFGELPGWLYVCGRCFLEAGDADQAVQYLLKARMATPQDDPMRAHVDRYFEDAIKRGGKTSYGADPEFQLKIPLDRMELEACLDRFVRSVQAEHRMSFWRLDDGKREWCERPERHGQNLLRIFLKGVFDDRIEVLEEVEVGAGRLDLYLLLRGGLRIVVELKMCGEGYSSSYAFEGLGQLDHYMENKATKLGYLIVFDGRRRDFGKGLNPIESINGHMIGVRFVDLRPEVKPSAKEH